MVRGPKRGQNPAATVPPARLLLKKEDEEPVKKKNKIFQGNQTSGRIPFMGRRTPQTTVQTQTADGVNATGRYRHLPPERRRPFHHAQSA